MCWEYDHYCANITATSWNAWIVPTRIDYRASIIDQGYNHLFKSKEKVHRTITSVILYTWGGIHYENLKFMKTISFMP